MKGILFDLDGTLIDSMEVWNGLEIGFVEDKGYDFKEDTVDQLKSMTIEQLPGFFKEIYGFDTSLEEIADYMTGKMISHYANDFEYKEGVEEKLKEIKAAGIAMCITTATTSDILEPAVDRLALMIIWNLS